jgi:uncharacterized protein
MAPVTDRRAMIAGMNPVLQPGRFRFATLAEGCPVPPDALGSFREAEGLSLILPAEGGAGPEMCWIVLTVHSALEGVGLTAAVSTALAAEEIACNMVAAHHHDHVFVPAAEAERALVCLLALQASAD